MGEVIKGFVKVGSEIVQQDKIGSNTTKYKEPILEMREMKKVHKTTDNR